MLSAKELDDVIHKPLQKILDNVNNHIDRDNYKVVQETLNQVSLTIRAAIKQKGE